MKKFSILFTLTIMLSLVFAFPGDGYSAKRMPEEPVMAREAFMERSPGIFDPGEYLEKQRRTFDWLMAESVPLSSASIFTIHVSREELAEIENDACETCGDLTSGVHKVRIGLVKPVGVKVDFGDLAPGSLVSAASQAAADGGYVWTAAAESKDAAALRVHFTHFSLPENAALYIYNMNGEAFGPYTGHGPGNDGDFWSHTVSGPVAYIQVRHFGPAVQENLQAAHFVIEGIGHIGPKFPVPSLQKSPEERENGDISRTLEHCSYNAPCIEDASCYSGGPIDDAKFAIAYMEWISGAWIYSCTGGLLADTNVTTYVPYLLTANHCLSKSKDAVSLECYFFYWTPYCGGCDATTGPFPRTLGAEVLSTNETGDYTLLLLWEPPPAGSFFLGWTTQEVAFSHGTQLFRISHPLGAPQAYSQHVVDTTAPTCSGWPRGDWIYSRNVIGGTEAGSNGAPVMLLNGQVVGQLTGICGYNIYDPCDYENNATVDGAFASYYMEVMSWLAPNGEGKMHVHAIELSTKTKGSKTDAVANVTIVDETGSPVPGATVTGTFSGDVSGTQSADTNAKGVATLKITITGSITTFTFCVDDVTHASYTYDPEANVETCDTY
jgi:lysyl endopeptidase